MKKIFLGCSVFFSLITTGCYTSQKTEIQQKPASDPYALQPIDTTSIEFPENAVVVTPAAYQPSFTIINDLVHTRLDVKFDWNKMYLYGKAWITLKPHFYATDSLKLDAKGFDIHEVSLVKSNGKIPLRYSYDSLLLNIKLDKSYSKDENYTIYIDYTAKPNELKVKGSEAITDARGLYFINHDDRDPSKPRELWTQGETESNSAWFPTIDKPIMKMTTELSMTVENGFVTLSNGLMTSSKDNGDGTHTDTWKLDMPYAPYLVMMAAGPFSVVRDHWENIEVNYYLDKKYAPYAKGIFGKTPEMISFFSDRLGVPYPWPKYSQVVVHDFVSGAMENVTATVHYEELNQTTRDMIDGNKEDFISHELFHQWFGDLVTCESWSNISLNESFATYGTYLWNEYKYGKDQAELGRDADLQQYLYFSQTTDEPLIRFNYHDKEEIYDAISYQKGACILHMLRTYIGDDAFFQSLKKYLEDNRFGAAEVHQLRLAFEKVTGEDLNWFFNQWYLSGGYPILDIQYNYDLSDKQETLTIRQKQNTDTGIPIFRLPMNVDVYAGGAISRHRIVIEKKEQTFVFSCDQKPDLVNVDADKALVGEKNDNKSDTAFAFQMEHAPAPMDKIEAIRFFSENTGSPFYRQSMLHGLNGRFWGIRSLTLADLKIKAAHDADGIIRNKIIALANADSSSQVRAAALTQMGKWKDKSVIPPIQHALMDSSYLVVSTALQVFASLDSIQAYKAAAILEHDSSDEIVDALSGIYARMAGEEKNNFFLNHIKNDQVAYTTIAAYGQYVSRWVSKPEIVESGLAVLYSSAENDRRWYVRFAAMNALANIHTAMITQQESWNNELLQSEAGSEMRHQVQSQLEWLTNQIAELEKKITDIKAEEKDENLKLMYNSR